MSAPKANDWLDRGIDLVRSLHSLFLLAGLTLGWLLFSSAPSPDHVYLTVTNHDELMVESLRMEFGFDHNQSEILSLQLRPGESRLLLLNHPPGRGFNVEVRYANGDTRTFCANRGNNSPQQRLPLLR